MKKYVIIFVTKTKFLRLIYEREGDDESVWIMKSYITLTICRSIRMRFLLQKTANWQKKSHRNETGYEIQYDMKCYIYKKGENGWGLCSTDYIDFSDEIHTLNFGEVKTQKYSIDGYVIEESGLYKFVTFVDGKAIWVEFEIILGPNKILQYNQGVAPRGTLLFL